MNNILTKIIAIVAIVLIASDTSKAQDPHYSMYDASPVWLNPATTGMFENNYQKYRLATQYRSQWGLLGGRITTTDVAYDMALNKQWGVGGYLLNYDSPNNFGSFHFVASGAYKITQPEQEKHLLSVGLQVGLINKFNKDLTFDNQYSSGNFDNDLPSGETYNKSSFIMPEVNLGINYKNTDAIKKINPYGGFSIMHITHPKESFLTTTSESRLPLRFVLNGGTIIKVAKQVSIDPNFVFMRQRNANNIVVGLRANYDLNSGGRGNSVIENSTNIIAGFSYRVKDAVIGEIGLKYKSFTYKVCYDYTVSGLKSFNNSRGATELVIIYKGR